MGILAAAVLSGLAPSCTTTHDRTALLEILTRIERREVADGFLRQALEQGDEPTRAWAARGLGASRDPAALDPLIAAVADESTWVRSAALSALAAVEVEAPNELRKRERVLLDHLESSEPVLRFLAAQGLGRIGCIEAYRPLIEALTDPAPTVRKAATFSLLQLVGDETRNRRTTSAKIPDESPGYREAWLAALRVERDPEVRWHLVYALAHRKDPANHAVLRDSAARDSAGRWERLFAIRGLGQVPGSIADRNTLAAVLRDHDEVLVTEALTAIARLGWRLDRRPDHNPTWPDQLAPTLASMAADHTSASIRALAIQALAAIDRASAAPVLVAAQGDASPTVRAMALWSYARVGAIDRIEAALRGPRDWREQLGAARGLRHFDPERIAPLLQSLPSLDSRVELELLGAIASVGERHSDATPARKQLASWATTFFDREDSAFTEAAADALAALGDAQAVEQLISAWRDAAGRTERTAAEAQSRSLGFATARAQLARAIGQLAPGHAALREIADHDPVAFVRHATGLTPSETAAPTVRPGPEFGKDIKTEFLFHEPRPKIRLRTDRGAIVIELLPELAPVHCCNLLTLVRSGAYDGRVFHRVVPNFVVQGGDARGDGFGNVAWYDGPLRDELNPLPFLAGRVGMPRTQDRDTGGDQMFITTVPTPHLDGHYTAFARVVEGLDTVRRLEIGDVINTAEIVD